MLASFLSVTSSYYFYSHDNILQYGDAVAHINIARRVFDSQFPGLSLMVWAIYFYCRFATAQRKALLEAIEQENSTAYGEASGRALLRCGLVLAAAMLTRYDYWFLAALMAGAGAHRLYVEHRNLG